ncbi:hypothetical protein D3C71_2013360 [compost metagenome]
MFSDEMDVSNRACNAPSLARSPLMNDSAESTVFKASVAFLKVVTSRLATSCKSDALSAGSVVLNALVVVALVENDFSESSTT